MVVPAAGAAPLAVAAGTAGFSSPLAESRKLRTPLPSWPSTSGSLPAPKTISTTARMRRSSGPPMFGIVVLPRARPRRALVFSQSTHRSDEEAVEQTEEERDDDEEHERGQIAEHQDQHEVPFDPTRGIERACALVGPESLSLVAQHRQRAAAETT